MWLNFAGQFQKGLAALRMVRKPPPTHQTLFTPNVCLADDATVFLVFATDMCGEVVEASANRIKAELEKLRCDLRRVDRRPEPVGKLGDGIFRCLRGCHYAEPDLDIVILIA